MIIPLKILRILKKYIGKSKRDHWKALLDELDEDIWGEGYRIATRYLAPGNLNYKLPTKTRRRILRELFPTTTESIGGRQRTNGLTEPFTMQEMLDAMALIKDRKMD